MVVKSVHYYCVDMSKQITIMTHNNELIKTENNVLSSILTKSSQEHSKEGILCLSYTKENWGLVGVRRLSSNH